MRFWGMSPGWMPSDRAETEMAPDLEPKPSEGFYGASAKVPGKSGVPGVGGAERQRYT